MKEFIAICGLDCEKCDARIATLNNDDELRAKTAKLWSTLNGVEITAEMINCVGCQAEGVKTPFCETVCPIRKCALSKNLASCCNCIKMDQCLIVKTITDNNCEALENLKDAKCKI